MDADIYAYKEKQAWLKRKPLLRIMQAVGLLTWVKEGYSVSPRIRVIHPLFPLAALLVFVLAMWQIGEAVIEAVAELFEGFPDQMRQLFKWW